MNFLTLLTIVSAICGIISFFASKFFKSRILLWSFIVFILSFASGLAVYYNSELVRINDIHKKADAIYNDYVPFGPDNMFIQESLTFLEENKDRYPDAYKRATQIYQDMKGSEHQFTRDAAIEIQGIIKGISTLTTK
jgi:hypothetical protein